MTINELSSFYFYSRLDNRYIRKILQYLNFYFKYMFFIIFRFVFINLIFRSKTEIICLGFSIWFKSDLQSAPCSFSPWTDRNSFVLYFGVRFNQLQGKSRLKLAILIVVLGTFYKGYKLKTISLSLSKLVLYKK